VSPDQRQADSVILELYEGSTTVPFSQFQQWALARLQKLIHYDAAWWGKVSGDPPRILRVHTDCASDTILDDYHGINDEDYFRDAMLAAPGRTINLVDLGNRDHYLTSALYLKYGRKHRIEHLIGTVRAESDTSTLEFLSIWRFDARWPFSERDRLLKEQLMPHLVEAYRINRLVSLRRAMAGELNLEGAFAWALVGPDDACFIEANAACLELIKQEWSDWHGAIAPEPIHKHLKRCSSFKGERIIVDISDVDGYRLLVARQIKPYDRLGARERMVIERYANSESHRSIAIALGTSPTTVRNQLSNAYKKLGVHNKIELLKTLNRIKD